MTEKVDTRESISETIEKLEPRAIFGINGQVEFGLHLHPDGKHMVYPLGSKIGIGNMDTNRQEFISGHTNTVSCIAISKSGRYMASGQINHMGFRAYVIVWDFAQRKELGRHDLHKVRVQSLCFLASERCVISIGGQDDGSLIVFDMMTYAPICRSVAARSISGNPLCVRALNIPASFFVVAGDLHLRIWSIRRKEKKLHVHDVSLGKHHRRFTNISIDKNDEFAYLGTMSGDVVKVVLNCCDNLNVTKVGQIAAMLGAFGRHNPRKPYGKDCDRWVNGVRDVHIVDTGLLLIGAGDGVLELVEERKEVNVCMFKNYPCPTWPMFKSLKSTKVNGTVTSLVQKNPIEYYIATDKNEIYMLNIKTFNLKLLKTCHQETVYCIIFPKNLSTVFATAGYESIRIWSTRRLQELLRIMVYNFYCASIVFTHDGTSIISAWNDGVIRAFTPITGRLIYAIPNAHNKGCSVLAVSSNGRLLVTGGIEGQVRLWKIEPYRQSLIGVLKDHSGPISSLDFNHLDTEVISASSDGSCVIWDVNRLCRKQVITANTQFMSARYFPTGVHILSSGSDGRINYWMVYNGALIREIEGSKRSSINCVAINGTGDYFVSVGSDQLVKLWDYNRGTVVCLGSEHASPVTSVAYSPCRQFFVTGSSDGSVIIWDVPKKYWGKANPPPASKPSASVDVPKNEHTLEPKQRTSARSITSNSKKENIDNLLASTKKNDITCVECPPINSAKKHDVNENCNQVPLVNKC